MACSARHLLLMLCGLMLLLWSPVFASSPTCSFRGQVARVNPDQKNGSSYILRALDKVLQFGGITNIPSCMSTVSGLLSGVNRVPAMSANSARVRSITKEQCSLVSSLIEAVGSAVWECNATANMANNWDDFREENFDNCCNDTRLKSGTCYYNDVISQLRSISANLISNDNQADDTKACIISKLHPLSQTINEMMSLSSDSSMQQRLLFDLASSASQLAQLVGTLSSQTSKHSAGLANSQGIIFLVCSALLPQCMDDRRLPPCYSSCVAPNGLLSSLQLFLNVSSLPILHLIREVSRPCHHNFPRPSASPCISLDLSKSKGYEVINDTASLHEDAEKLVEGFCLNTKCPHPLRATTTSKHWLPGLQMTVQSFRLASLNVFPNSTLPLNKNLLPCALDCMTVGFSPEEHRDFRSLVRIASSVSVASVILSVTIFFFNRHDLLERRLYRSILLFNIFSGLSLAAYPLYSVDKLAEQVCREDGTLLTHQPESVDSVCGILGVWSYFTGMMAVGYFVVVMVAWQQSIQNIDTHSVRRTSTVSSRHPWRHRFDIISFFSVFIPAAALATTVTLEKGFDGSPLFGSCYLSIDRKYFINFYVWEHLISIVVSVVFLIKTLHKVIQLHGYKGTIDWIKGNREPLMQKQSEPQSPRLHRNSTLCNVKDIQPPKALDGLARKFLFYLTFALLSFCGSLSLAAYVCLMQEEWEAQTDRHIQCKLTSCQPEKCPPLPSPSFLVFANQTLINFLSVFFMATWIYRPRFLKNVPLLRKLVNRETLDEVTLTSPVSTTSRRRFFSARSSVSQERKPSTLQRSAPPSVDYIVANPMNYSGAIGLNELESPKLTMPERS